MLFMFMHSGLGNTVTEIDVSGAKVFPKTVFSMVIPEVEAEMSKHPDIKSVVLFGIEVCYLYFEHNYYYVQCHMRYFMKTLNAK